MRKLNLIILLGILLVSIFLILKNPTITGNVILEGEDYKCPECNVILISIDTLRADHLGCYGYFRDTAPFLCEFAKEGILFEDLTNTGGGTLPVHMSMMTSLYPKVHGFIGAGRFSKKLEKERITLAEQLKEGGYKTVAFTGGALMNAKFGFDQGLDLYNDEGRNFDKILPKVYNWLDNNHNKKFFLFIHTYDVHAGSGPNDDLPYSSPENYNQLYYPDYNGKLPLRLINTKFSRDSTNPKDNLTNDELKYIIALYDGGITYVDKELNLFLERLKDLRIYDKTLIIITADHGEEFLEHGFMSHTASQYQELTHIPMIMKLPYSRIKNKRISELVSIIDLMPTILELVNIEINEQAQGKSVVPLIFHNQPIRNLTYMGPSIRTEEWKLFPRRNELYNMITDGKDRYNVIDDYPEIAEMLTKEYNKLIKRDKELREIFLSQNFTQEEKEFNQELYEELRALGYMN